MAIKFAKAIKRIWRWVSEFETFGSITSAAGLTWSMLLAVLAAMYAWLGSIPGPYIVGLGAIVFGATFAGLYFYSKWAGAIRIYDTKDATIGSQPKLPDYPILPLDPMESVFRERSIRLIDLIGSGPTVIADKRFERCRLIGPGIITMLSGSSLRFCAVPDVREFWVYLELEKKYRGVVMFERCSFDRCEFFQIDFSGSHDMRQHLIDSVGS